MKPRKKVRLRGPVVYEITGFDLVEYDATELVVTDRSYFTWCVPGRSDVGRALIEVALLALVYFGPITHRHQTIAAFQNGKKHA
jgi:hypothetical protein